MDYYWYYLKHFYYWLYCIYMPSDKVLVACVDRKKVTDHHYYHIPWYDTAKRII